jgi:hypothetical protein
MATDYGLVRSRRLPVGVPLGGIGCGTFELMTDGAIAHATINNNWSHPSGDIAGSFAAVWARAGDQTAARVLRLTPAYGLATVAAIDFRGLCPTATVDYADPALPVDVRLRAFSPLIPGDLRNSALPAAVFVFTLRNEARGPVDAAIALSWESLLGVGGTPAAGAFADRSGNAARALPVQDGVAGVLFDDEAAPLLPPAQRYRLNARGTCAILAQPSHADAHVATATWNALDAAPPWWPSFAAGGEVSGAVGTGVEGKVHPAGVVSVKVPLAARQSVNIAFTVTWHTPRFYSAAGVEYGHYYEKTFDDALQVGRYVLESRQPFAALTEEWQNAILRSSLPPVIAHRVIDDTALLLTRTVMTRDTGGPEDKPGPWRFGVLAGATSKAMLLGDLAGSRYYASMLASLYPELSGRELHSYAAMQAGSGELRSAYGSVDAGILAPEGADAPPTARDSETLAAWAYRLLMTFKRTGDQRLMDELYPSAKRAAEAFVRAPAPLAESACAGREALMRIALLRTMQALAEAMPDREFARGCSSAADGLRDELVRSYWSGLFLRCKAEPSSVLAADGQAVSVRKDMLAGQWLADALDLGDLLPAPVMRQCVDSLAAAFEAGNTVDLDEVAGTGWCSVPETLTAAASLLALRGRADAAVRVVEALSREVCDRLLTPWRPPVRFATGAGTETVSPGSLEAFASFNVLSALSGVDMDVTSGRLRIAPRVPRGWKVLDLPVFHPRFWGRVMRRSGLGRTVVSLRVDRLMKLPSEEVVLAPSADLVVREVILPDDLPGGKSIAASIGRMPVPGKLGQDARGRSVFTPETQMRLAVGQRLDMTFR